MPRDAARLDNRSRHAVLGVVLALILCLAFAVQLAPAAAAAPKPGALYDCLHRAEQPRQILIACGDGATRARHLVWRTHTRTKATGHGVMTLLICTPTCPKGHNAHRRFTFTLHRPRLSGARRVFTRLTVSYQRRTPGGRHQTYQLACHDAVFC